MKTIFGTEEVMNKKIHNIYLGFALTIGIVLSIFMPLFSEPDGPYHYTVSTNIVGLSNDLSAYGETEIVTGINKQIPHYQRGDFFKTYFQNHIKQMPIENLPRQNKIPSKDGYNYWGHVIPGVGTWLGHLLYPSLGVMTVVGRLFSTLICALSMFFIIKWVKAGKLLFFVLSLSPVTTSIFASLSYDATTYVLSAFTIAAAINIVVRKQIIPWDYVYFLISMIALWFGGKTNTKLLIGLIPFIMLVTYLKNRPMRGERLRRHTYKSYFYRSLKIFIPLAIVTTIIVLYIKPTLAFAMYRIIISHLINVTPGLTVNSIFQSLLAAPYAGINYIPFWVSAVWYILVVLVILVEKKYVWSPWISWFSIFLFFLGFGAVYYSFTTFIGGASVVSQNRMVGAIVGVQGRYFTPTLLLFSLFTGYEKFTYKLASYRLVTLFAFVVILISNAMLLFGTLFGIYYLS